MSTRVLMAAHPTVGHTSALRAIGARLIEQGHPVALAMVDARLPFQSLWPEALRAATGLPAAIAREGIEVLSLAPSLGTIWHAARIARKTGHDELEVAIELFTSGVADQARDLARHARAWRADVIVADYLMPAALLGAELAGLPVASLYHSALPFPVEGAAPFGSGLDDTARGSARWQRAESTLARLGKRFDERVATATRSLGLASRGGGLLAQPISPHLNLLATSPELEPGLAPLRGNVLMTGPCLPRVSPSHADDPALRALPDEGLRLYVSLGTVFNAQPAVFDHILDGLAGLDAHVVVSAGASFERISSRSGPRTHVFRRVPQVPLLARVDAVVTHGGNNTVQECLAAGCSMVVIPFGGDQLENARRIERLGVGVAVHPSRLTAASLREAMSRASAPEVTTRAKELAASLAGRDGAQSAAAAVLALVGERGARAAGAVRTAR